MASSVNLREAGLSNNYWEGKDFIKPLIQKLGRVLWRINVIGKESTEVGVPKLLAHWQDKIRTCVIGQPF
jgi:hypothetical protein